MIDDLALVREIYNADPTPPSPDVLDWTRGLLLAEVVAESPAMVDVSSHRDGRHDASRRRRRVVTGGLVAITTAAAVVLGGVLLPASHNGGPTLAPSAAAAAVLDGVAQTANSQPAFGTPATGRYMYTRTSETDLSVDQGTTADSPAYRYYETQITQQWRTANGAGRTKITYRNVRFMTARDEAMWKAAHQPWPRSVPTTQSYGPSKARASEFLSPKGLPTDPAKLEKVFVSRYGQAGAATTEENMLGVVDAVAILYNQVGTPPALRGALLEALGRTPGIHAYGTVTVNEHAGQAVGVLVAGYRIMLVFNPSTAALLARETIVWSPQVAAKASYPGSAPDSQLAKTDPRGTITEIQQYATPRLVKSDTHT